MFTYLYVINVIILFAVTCAGLSLVLTNGETTFDRNRIYDTTNFSVGTIASFKCDDGYSLEGPGSTTCQLSGNWDQSKPSCRKNGKKLRVKFEV